MVHAREGAAGVAFLELGDGDVTAAALVEVTAAVEPRHAVVDPAGIVDAQLDLARQGFGERDVQLLRRRHHAEGTRQQFVSAPDAAAPDGELGGVQHERGGGLRQAQSDVHMAIEGEAAQVRDQSQAVVQGQDFGHEVLPGGWA